MVQGGGRPTGVEMIASTPGLAIPTYANFRDERGPQVDKANLQTGLAVAAVVAHLPAKSHGGLGPKELADGHGEDKGLHGACGACAW